MTLRDQLQTTLTGTHTLERELGGGGMSKVFVAEETRLGRKVVIKVLSPELAQGLSVDRFEREIKTVAALQQANIVPVLTAGDTQGLPFYTMPFVDGESLRVKVERGPLAVTEVIGIMRDVAKALAYAHEHGVVHRDIKPDNVLISGGTAVVTDFGIAKAISASRHEAPTGRTESLTQLGTSIGTPAYMSPEQAAGDPDVDHRADIYSLGCMVYELLVGTAPFAGRTPARTLSAHMSEAPKPITEHRGDLPLPLASLVMQCLAKEPADRPQSAHDVAQILEGVASGSGSHATASMLAGGSVTMGKALAIYAGAVVAVAVFAKAAIVGIGLPSWVFPGSMVVMALTLALRAAPRMTWARTARGGAFALGAFAIVVTAFMIMRAFGIGPVGSLIASGDFAARDRIIITDFTVSSGDSALGRVVGDAIRAGLADSRVFTTVTPTEVAGSLARMQRPATSRITLDVARQIALREGVKAVVDGDVTPVGSSYIIVARLVSADSGRELTSYRATASSADAIITVADELSRKLRAKAGESLRTVQGTPALAYASTGSLEALRKYSEGARANDAERDYRKAIRLLREAVALDSNFAEGWRKLAAAIRNSGLYPPSAGDSAIRKAFSLVDRMTERERDAVLASYYGGSPGFDRAKAVATYERMLARGDSVVALNNLAIQYSSRQQHAKAEMLYRAAVRMSPGTQNAYSNLMGVLNAQSKIKERDSLLNVAIARFPTSTSFGQTRINYLFDASRMEEGLKALDSAQKTPDPRNPGWVFGRLAQIRVTSGRLREYRTLQTRAREIVAALGNPSPSVFAAAEQLTTRVELDLPHEAELKAFDTEMAKFDMEAIPVSDRPYLYFASVNAVIGRPDRAKAFVARHVAAVTDTAARRWQAPSILDAQANIAFGEKRYLDAIRLLREGSRRDDGPVNGCVECVPLGLTRLFAEAGMADSALHFFAEYKKTPVGSRPREGPDYRMGAPMHEALAKLYEAKGDTANAAVLLRDFIEMWKDADAELQPRVAAARKRLAELTPAERPRR